MYIHRNATTARVATGVGAVELKVAGSGSRGWVIFNDGGFDLYVLASTNNNGNEVSATNFTWKVPAGQHLQEPYSDSIYIGALRGISPGGAGNAQVTTFWV